MDHTMKISTLLLSSAAVLVAGAAFAADLPAKKAAPAAAPTGCAAFGAGFFQIPGGDNCIKFSGRVTADQTFADPKSDRTKSFDTFGSSFRLNTDVRANSDAGVVRAFSRIEGSTDSATNVKYAYAQIGGLTAGLADSAFTTLNNPWGWLISTDDGKRTNLLSYTASLGGTTSLTVAVEDATKRTNSSTTNPATTLGASQIPDLVGAVKTVSGALTLQGAVATHQNHGLTSGDTQGYAVQAAATLAAAPGTTLYLQGAYANAALSYLGYTNTGDAVNADVSATAKGYSVFAAVNQAAGPGSVSLNGVYGSQTPAGNGSDIKQTQFELNYDYTGIKGVQVIPAVYYSSTDNGNGTTTSGATGFLRIERDF
jgi:hypothetical protein